MCIAECPSIPGCVSQGRTAEEAQMTVQDAIRECLEVRAEKGLPLTVMTRQVEVHVWSHQSRFWHHARWECSAPSVGT